MTQVGQSPTPLPPPPALRQTLWPRINKGDRFNSRKAFKIALIDCSYAQGLATPRCHNSNKQHSTWVCAAAPGQNCPFNVIARADSNAADGWVVTRAVDHHTCEVADVPERLVVKRKLFVEKEVRLQTPLVKICHP